MAYISYSLDDGASFAAHAAKATFSLEATNDEATGPNTQRASMLRWDRKTKRIVKGDGGGADNKRLIRTESGARLPASFKSGRFDEWKAKSRVGLPRVGEAELPGRQGSSAGRKWTHKGRPGAEEPPVAKAKFQQKGKVPANNTKMRNSAHRGSKPGAAKGGLRNAEQITKERKMKDNRKRRSEMPSKKKKSKR